MAFTYGYYIKPYIFISIIAFAIIGVSSAVFATVTESKGSVKTCLDFKSQWEAQRAFNKRPLHYARLDGDRNGFACDGVYYKKK